MFIIIYWLLQYIFISHFIPVNKYMKDSFLIYVAYEIADLMQKYT